MRVTRSLIEIYSSVRIDGITYLARSLEHKFNTPKHNALRVAGGIWLLGFTIGIPIIGFGVLAWMFRTGRENDPRWRTAFGFLSDGYKRKFFWWEAAVLVRKLALLLVAVVLSPDDGFLQAFSAVCVLAVSMVVQAWAQPYETTMINVLDMTAMAAVFATRLGAILYDHFDPFEPGLNPKCVASPFDIDLACKGGRIKLGTANGFVLIGIQVLLVLLFAVVMAKEKIYELFFAPKKLKKMKKCWRKCVKRCSCGEKGASRKEKKKKQLDDSDAEREGRDAIEGEGADPTVKARAAATAVVEEHPDRGIGGSAVRGVGQHRPSAFVRNNPLATHSESRSV